MSPPKSSPYGSWPSPITSDLIVAQSIALSEVRLDGDSIYWLEARPQEQGRLVVVRADWRGGGATDITPRPYSARTRVHEYGGGAWTVSRGIVYFSNFSDGRLYRCGEAAPRPEALTPAPPAPDRQWRFADGVIDHARQRWIGVREDHTAEGEAGQHHRGDRSRPGGSRSPAMFSSADTTSSPPRGFRRTAIGCSGWRGTIPTCRGTAPCSILPSSTPPVGLPSRRPIAGGPAELIFQPEWSPDGRTIYFVSDRSNWWNLYGFDPGTRITQALAPMAAEFGGPQWNLGMSTYACLGSDRIVCAYYVRGPRPACGAGACRQDVAADRDAVHGVRLGQGRRRARRVSRRRTRPSNQHRRAGFDLAAASHPASRPPRFSTRVSRASPIG